MKVLIDIVHPAQAHFFHDVIIRLKNQGHNVMVTSRDKDVTIRLLKAWKVDHICLSQPRRARLALAREWWQRNKRLIGVTRSFRPAS